METPEKLRSTKRVIATIIFFLVLVNFTVFWVVTLALGGTPCLVEEGRYYLCDHGQLTQVSEGVYAYIYFHERMTWFSVLLIPLVIFLDRSADSG